MISREPFLAASKASFQLFSFVLNAVSSTAINGNASNNNTLSFIDISYFSLGLHGCFPARAGAWKHRYLLLFFSDFGCFPARMGHGNTSANIVNVLVNWCFPAHARARKPP